MGPSPQVRNHYLHCRPEVCALKTCSLQGCRVLKQKQTSKQQKHSMKDMTCNMETSLRNRAARAFTQPLPKLGTAFHFDSKKLFQAKSGKDRFYHTVDCRRMFKNKVHRYGLYVPVYMFVFVHTVWDKNIGEDLTTMERKPSSENVVQAPHKGARLFVRSTGHRCPDHAPTSGDLDSSDYAIN